MDMVMEKKADEAGPKIAVVAKATVEAAVSAVVNLIVETLQADSQGKFAEAARLCNVGQSLMRTQAKRMEDFAVLEVENDGDQNMAAPARRGNAYFPVNDRGDAEREFMLTFGQNAQIQAEAQKAAVAREEAQELATLTATAASMAEAERGPLQARIRILIENMEVRNNARKPAAGPPALPAAAAGNADPEPGVVPPQLPRGHQAGAGGPGADDAQGVRADANGAQGHGAVAFACHIPEAPQGLGG
jgi:hypothetical protein